MASRTVTGRLTPYWRYAIDLFPEFKKERVPVARFLCDKRERTFSILPSQLMPYFQYTVNAVIGTLLLVLHYRQMGQKGLHGASVAVDPDTLPMQAFGRNQIEVEKEMAFIH